MADRGRNPTVVIADDDALIRAVLSAALQRRGFTVVEAEDGPSAALAVASHAPDLLILDARMPGATLAETFVAVRGSEPGLPILILTGQQDEPPEASLERTRFLTKPVQLSELWAQIDTLVARGDIA